jgi:hypothetical protein
MHHFQTETYEHKRELSMGELITLRMQVKGKSCDVLVGGLLASED